MEFLSVQSKTVAPACAVRLKTFTTFKTLNEFVEFVGVLNVQRRKAFVEQCQCVHSCKRI